MTQNEAHLWKEEQRHVAKRWKDAQDEIARILYAEDPEGMGSSVGAPEDEYGDAAIFAMRELRDRRSGTATDTLRKEWPGLSTEAAARITAIWRTVERGGHYHCPCCGYRTMPEMPPGTFHICELCWWEDDNVQHDDPDYRGGANKNSLTEERAAFIRFLNSGFGSTGWRKRPDFEKHGTSVFPEVQDAFTASS